MSRTPLMLAALSVVAAGASDLQAAYNLTNASGTTVKYEAKESATNSTTANSIIRSLGLAGDETFGFLSDATFSFSGGSGPAFTSPDTGFHGIPDVNNFITQSGANRSILDLTFNAAPGQGFLAGDLRVNTTVFPSPISLWDVNVDFLAWQVSYDGGANFIDIHKRFFLGDGIGQLDSGVVPIPGISGRTSFILRGIMDSSGGASNTPESGHWHLIDTPPFAPGTFAGGLELNLTSQIPEPASAALLAVAVPLLLLRRR